MAVRAPNILYLVTDQQSAGAMSCAGNRDLRTPAMDRIAAEGMRFERAYCTQPLCTPSRASMFTGLMPHEAGAPLNGQSIRADLRARELGHVLRQAGYTCTYAGKWHVPEAEMPDGHGFTRIGRLRDEAIAEACVDFLRQPHARPFFLVASFTNPHNICEWARSQPLHEGPIPEPASVEECPALPPNFDIPDSEPEIIRVEQRAHFKMHPTAGYTRDDWRRYRFAYYRLVEKVDAELARVLAALDATGHDRDTLVIFSSDHGDGQGAHQWNQKCVLYEESVRVPLMARLPGRIKPGSVEALRLTSNGLDLFPTLCDFAGITPPVPLPGRSLRPLLEGRPPSAWRDHVFVETVFDGGRGYGTEGRMVRTARYKYCIYSMGRNREQLIDLLDDPGELGNLAGDPRHGVTLDEHRRRLKDCLTSTGDPNAWQFFAET